MIHWENSLRSSLEDMSNERSRMGRHPWQCMFLRNSSLVLHNSSLACECSFIALREASISAIRRTWFSHVSSRRQSWLARASARSRSCSARAFSQICSCSRWYSLFSYWKALMVSVIFCKVETSSLSGLCAPCLVFLITSNCLAISVGGFSFYLAPRWASNVLVDWPGLDLGGGLRAWLFLFVVAALGC